MLKVQVPLCVRASWPENLGAYRCPSFRNM